MNARSAGDACVAGDGHGDHVAIDHLAELDSCVVAIGHDVGGRVAQPP